MNWAGFHSLGHAWLLLLLGPLVLFYFLKLKRPRVLIPSLVLWRQVVRDQRVNSPFQKFKRNILLLLQILLLLLLALAAMQPFWRGQTRRSRRYPVLVDCSASMGALDKEAGTTRLDEAKRRVRDLIDRLPPEQELCLVAFSDTARRRTGFTTDKRLLRETLDALTVQSVASDLESALRLAQALARTEPFDEVLLFSDGNFPMRANFDLPFTLNYQRVAPGGLNLGLTALSARGGVDGGWDVFAQVEGAPGNATLVLRRGEVELGRERLTVAAGRAQRLLFRVPGGEAATLRAILQPDGFDSLASDNEATLTLPESRSLRVYVPPALNSYRQALAVMGGVELIGPATNEIADLVITDRSADATLPARVRLLVGLVPPELNTFLSIGTNGTPVVDWRRETTVLQHVELGDLLVLDQPRLRDGATETDLEKLGWEVLAHGQRGPLLLQKRDGASLTWALLFHTDRSTLPYRVGFPIFVANVVQGARQQAGLAEARATRGLLSPSETSLAAVEQIQFNERLTVAASAPLKSDRSLWRLLALLALGVLVVEWWYFSRKPGRA